MFEEQRYNNFINFTKNKLNNTVQITYDRLYSDSGEIRLLIHTLLHSRVKDYKVVVAMDELDYTQPDIENKFYIEDDTEFNSADTSIYIANIKYIPTKFEMDDANNIIESFCSLIKEKYGDYEHLEDCESLHSYKGFRSTILKAGNRFFVFEPKLEYYGILAILPKFFENILQDKHLTDAEKHLFENMFYGNRYVAENYWDDVIKESNIKQEILNYEIENLFSKANETRVSYEEGIISDKITRIEQLISDIEYLEKERKEHVLMREALLAHKEDPRQKEFIDYLVSSKEINIEMVRDTNIYICVDTTIENYDPEAYKTISKSSNLFMNSVGARNINQIFTDWKMVKKLCDYIFNEDPMFKVKVSANYIIEAENGRVIGIGKNDTGFIVKQNTVPNAHISIHRCLGGYRTYMANAVKDQDLILVANLCIQSAQSLDLDETQQTANPFIYSIISSKDPCLVDKNGELYTAAQALAKIIENEMTEGDKA